MRKTAFSLLVVATLAGCSTAPGEKAEKAEPDFPEFVTSASPAAQKAYRLAYEHSDVLEKMPCFCGCGDTHGHRSNLNCFIKEKQANGKVVWDQMGISCGICIEIAENAVKMKKEGKSMKEIRQIIDEEYGGSGTSTPTPKPQ
ncbi:PCYCGC motif-containing (lipo)protein [Salinithrix halophila]|uniref:PCYCGC motif-containing (Lipo)protein n=1 Tax=Salinithrix halophila TaxID=1485204 RepID=A0ABV8JD51_9BACL